VTFPALAAAFVVVTLALPGCDGRHGVDGTEYVAANVATLDELPPFPGSIETEEVSTPYRENESGPVVGYGTRRDLVLPPNVAPQAVTAYYEDELLPEWEIVEVLDGPVVNFRRGRALVSVNVENWRVHRYEMGADHRHFDDA
jgi:hypothetical protein